MAFRVGSAVLLASILLMIVALPQRRADAAQG